MVKYTKKQRHEIYKKALDYVNNPNNKGRFEDWGLCHLFKRNCGVDSLHPIEKNFSHIYIQYRFEYKNSILPEIWFFIEDSFPDLNWDERRIILEFCIEMTK